MTIALFKTKVHEEAIENVNQVLRSGWLGLGPVVEQFEKEFAEYIGAPYAVAFSSGTAALHVAVKLLNVPRTCRMVSTPLTFVSSNHVALYEEIPILFGDIDMSTGNLSLSSLHKALSLYGHQINRPKVLMFVHYAGNVGDLDLLYEMADMYDVTIIEDCAHAAGAQYKIPNYGTFERVGKRAKLACFSFHAVKNLPLGDGGMLTTTSKEFAERAKILRWLGVTKSTADRTKDGKYGWKYDVVEVGFKSYMNDINAAIGLGQLKHLDEDNARRRKIYETYKEGKVPVLHAPEGSSHHMCVMLANSNQHKERIMEAFLANEIQYGCHYTPNYYYPMYKDCVRIDGCTNVEEFYSLCITLPTHLYLTDNDLDKIINVINGVR